MTVELAPVTRKDMIDTITVVGNLIGAATVDAVPEARAGSTRCTSGSAIRVRRGQAIAKIEDREIVEQIKQAEASYNVSQATIRQRQADLKLAQNNLERSKSLYERELLPRQTFDDTDARYQAAQAQLDLAMAQIEQTQVAARRAEDQPANTVITSPVDGFIGKRTLDPGACVGVEHVVHFGRRHPHRPPRRQRRREGSAADSPGHVGRSRSRRVSRARNSTAASRASRRFSIPATRTAQMEIEIPNSSFRLKPGMYARARFTVEKHDNTLVVPTNAVVDLQGKIGVLLPADEGDTPVFTPVTIGIEQQDFTEVTSGVNEGQRIITTGAAALRRAIALCWPASGAAGRPAATARAAAVAAGAAADANGAQPA